MSELANELRMTSSGLEDLPFPYAFPHPPDSPTTSPSDPDAKSPESHAELNSWMFYLSETSLRRIGNEIIWMLYDGPPSSWVKDIASVHKQAEQLDQKVVAWMDNLPKDLRIEGSIFELTNELGLHVRTRYIVWRAWIFRPFLYYMIHAPQSELLKHRKNIEPLASSCLDYSMQGINDATHHHRHHGSWYTARVAFGGALILLAAARVNSIAMPQGWEAAVQRAMHTMDRWSGESKNMEASLKIVKKLWDAAQE
ncbi:vegetative cell wall gp1 [Fusarium albosuccineum]|uniref:Vegetative cell wall gp1 n=1 Tax=Fusarium albosuccineum TaxID=1237068 RepID=A0A8H4KW25_9HYPO|nr:vegetative cell wall gp1 [Fusarium albosuccineum]